jgi:hypothetical protein
LYEVTQSPQGPSSSHVFGPTAGVRERNDPSVDTLVFRKDGPKSGAYVTSDPKIAAELNVLPQGLIEVDTKAQSEDRSTSRNATRDRDQNTEIDGDRERDRERSRTIGNEQDRQDAQRQYQDHPEHKTSYSSGSRDVPLSAHPTMFGHNIDSSTGINLTTIHTTEGVLEGVPGNLFDWGGWETWLASIGSDNLFNGSVGQPNGSSLQRMP